MWLLLLLFPPRLEISQQLGTHGAPGYARTLFLEPKKTSPQQGKRRSSNFSSSDHLSYFKTRKGDCRIPWTKPPKAWMHNAWYTVFLPLLHTLKVELACGGSPSSMHKHGALVKSECSFVAIQKCFHQTHWKLYTLFSPKQRRSLCRSKLYSDLGGALHSWFYRREEELLVYA